MNTEKSSNEEKGNGFLAGSVLKFTNGLTIEGNTNIHVTIIDGEINIKSDKGINLTMNYTRWIEFQK